MGEGRGGRAPVGSAGELARVAVEGEVLGGRVPALLHLAVPRLQGRTVQALGVVGMVTPEPHRDEKLIIH